MENNLLMTISVVAIVAIIAVFGMSSMTGYAAGGINRDHLLVLSPLKICLDEAHYKFQSCTDENVVILDPTNIVPLCADRLQQDVSTCIALYTASGANGYCTRDPENPTVIDCTPISNPGKCAQSGCMWVVTTGQCNNLDCMTCQNTGGCCWNPTTGCYASQNACLFQPCELIR